MVHDSARHQNVLFGGSTSLSIVPNGETWEWGGDPSTNWVNREVVGPSARWGHAMAFDSARGVTVLFGGSTGGDETWEWDGNVWNRRLVAGPSARMYPAMTYDAARGVVVLFGGATCSTCGPNQHNAETWEWNGETWTRRLVSGPSGRYGAAMSYDSIRQVSVLFGGSTDSGGGTSAETWEWDGSAWRLRAVDGPSKRYGHAMAYDPARRVTLLFGGWRPNIGLDGDTWKWNGSSWLQRIVAGPSPRYYHSMAFDSDRKTIMLFGGVVSIAGGQILGSDTWELNCFADLNGDDQTDDADFVIFAAAYDILDCEDLSMPAGCPSDLNRDGVVDDADFVMFVLAYDALVCP